MTAPFATRALASHPDVIAPDGSAVRLLLSLTGGSMAHFELAADATAHAVRHRTVEEIWFVVAGRGQMWRKQGEREAIVELTPGVCVTIPVGTAFQFRAAPDVHIAAIAITMPPWSGADEAVMVVGPWEPTAA